MSNYSITLKPVCSCPAPERLENWMWIRRAMLNRQKIRAKEKKNSDVRNYEAGEKSTSSYKDAIAHKKSILAR